MATSTATRSPFAVGGFSGEYHGGEDMDFALKLALPGALGVLPDCLTRMYQHGGNTGRRQLADMNARVLRRHLEAADIAEALDPELRGKLRRKVARYLVSVAKRAASRQELDALLAEAAAVDPAVRLRGSYLRLRWRRLFMSRAPGID